MITFDEAIRKLKAGKILELKFQLRGGLFSRHELSMERSRIIDQSWVDDSTTSYTVKQYQKSFYGKAFQKLAVELSEER